MAYTANCLYFDKNLGDFSDEGCRIGPRSTPLATQCYCNHLTDFSTVVKFPKFKVGRGHFGLKNLDTNPIAFSFCLSCFCLYVVILIWARRKDLDDARKVIF